MGRNKKLTKAVRERMARTGENYTAARTKLLEEEFVRPTWFRALSVEDVDVGTGDLAEPWRTLRVRYTMRSGDRVVDETGASGKVFALDAAYDGWMRAIVGMRAGGRRRIVGEFDFRGPRGRAFPVQGPCEIDVRLDAIEPYVEDPPQELVRGIGRAVQPGDRVRVRYQLRGVAQEIGGPGAGPGGDLLGGSGEAGLWATVGAGELEPAIERVVVGMRVGGSRSAVLRGEGSRRWLWLDLLEIG